MSSKVKFHDNPKEADSLIHDAVACELLTRRARRAQKKHPDNSFTGFSFVSIQI